MKDNLSIFRVIKLMIGILLILSCQGIMMTNKNQEYDFPPLNLPHISVFIPNQNYLHAKIVDNNSREIYYHDSIDRIPYQVITLEVMEIYYKEIITYLDKTIKVKDTITILISNEMFELIKEYDEFLVNMQNIKQTLITNENEIVNPEGHVFFINSNDMNALNKIVPIKDQKIHINVLSEAGVNLDYHILFSANNQIVKDPQYHFRDMMTIDELKYYFEIIKNSFKEDKNNKDPNVLE